jgi:hypothetical protein
MFLIHALDVMRPVFLPQILHLIQQKDVYIMIPRSKVRSKWRRIRTKKDHIAVSKDFMASLVIYVNHVRQDVQPALKSNALNVLSIFFYTAGNA